MQESEPLVPARLSLPNESQAITHPPETKQAKVEEEPAVLKQAKAAVQTAFIEALAQLFPQVCQEAIRLIYLAEAHIHRNMALGYTWATTGKPVGRLSDCVVLADRINGMGPMTAPKRRV